MWGPKQEKVRKPRVLRLYCWIFSMRMSEEERSVRVCFSLITTTALPIPALVSRICIITPRPVTGFYEQDVSIYLRKGSEALHVELASATGLSSPCPGCSVPETTPIQSA